MENDITFKVVRKCEYKMTTCDNGVLIQEKDSTKQVVAYDEGLAHILFGDMIQDYRRYPPHETWEMTLTLTLRVEGNK